MSKSRLRITVILGMLVLSSGSVVTAQGQCYDAPDGLVAWWAMDGDTADLEGVHHGVPYGNPPFIPGHVGDALQLNGVDRYVEVADHPELDITGAITIEGWINWPGWGNIFLAQKRVLSPNTGYAAVLGNTGRLDGTVYGRFDHTTPGSVVTAYEWTHVAWTYDMVDSKLYVNGVEVDSLGRSDPISTTDGALLIGAWLGSTGFGYSPGSLDEISIYSRALVSGEIHAIWEAGTAGKCKDEDGDGYRPPEDCDEANPWVNPDGLELPGNVIDENCDGDLGDCYPCQDWQNHGKYVRCVAHAVNDLVDAGWISEEAGDDLVSSAAQSDIGKQGYDPPQCQ